MIDVIWFYLHPMLQKWAVGSLMAALSMLGVEATPQQVVVITPYQDVQGGLDSKLSYSTDWVVTYNSLKYVYFLAIDGGINEGQCIGVNDMWGKFRQYTKSEGSIVQSLSDVRDIFLYVPEGANSIYAGKRISIAELLGLEEFDPAPESLIITQRSDHSAIQVLMLGRDFKELCPKQEWE